MTSNTGTRVGWDTPCEWLHADITASVQNHVSEHRIERFIREQAFLATVDQGVRTALQIDADSSRNKLKDMEEDVKTMKAMFCKHIGATWASATREKEDSDLFTDADADRGKTPWKQYEAVSNRTGADATSAYVRKHLMTYLCFHA